MKVNVSLATGALIRVKLKDGKTLTNKDVESVEIEPFFTAARGYGSVASLDVVTAGDEVTDRFQLVAGGRTGKLRRVKVGVKDKSVMPLIDKPKPPGSK